MDRTVEDVGIPVEVVRRACGPDAVLSGGPPSWSIDVPVLRRYEVVRVAWQNLGEGRCGRYDPSNVEDVNFLRFVTRRRPADGQSWTDVDHGSFLSRVAATASPQAQVEALSWVAGEIVATMVAGDDLGLRVRQISWVSELDSCGTDPHTRRLVVS